MRTKAALNKGARLFIDSNVLIYFIEGSDRYGAAAKRLFEQIARKQLSICSDAIVFAELLRLPKHERTADATEAYRQMFAPGGGILVEAIDPHVASDAAAIANSFGFGLIDSLHLATAVRSNCAAFITNDYRLSRFDRVPVLTLDQV